MKSPYASAALPLGLGPGELGTKPAGAQHHPGHDSFTNSGVCLATLAPPGA